MKNFFVFFLLIHCVFLLNIQAEEDPITVYVSDTLSVDEAYNIIKDCGGTIIIPPGTWEVTETLSFENKSVSIIGSGMGNSILCWTMDVPLGGISMQGDLEIDNTSLVLENITIKTNVLNNSGNAVNLIPKNPNQQQDQGNFPWFRATNCSFTGDKVYGKGQPPEPNHNGWKNIIYAKNALRMVITGCYFAGRQDLTPHPFIPSNVAIWIAPNDNGSFGAENLIDKCVFNWFSHAIYNEGAEGLKINNCNIVGCYIGLYTDLWHNVTGNLPCLMLTNSHVHASNNAVQILNTNGVHILGNHLYANDGNWDAFGGAPGKAIVNIMNCHKVNISDNDLVNHRERTLFTGIGLKDCKAGVVSGNLFHDITNDKFHYYISFRDTSYCIARMNTHNISDPNITIYSKLNLQPELDLNDLKHNMMEDEISEEILRN